MDVSGTILITPSIRGVIQSSAINSGIHIAPVISGVLHSSAMTGEITISLSTTKPNAFLSWIQESIWELHSQVFIENDGADLVIPMLLLSAQGYDSESGELDTVLPILTLDTETSLDSVAFADLAIPMLTLDAGTRIEEVGSADLILPMVKLGTEVAVGAVGKADLTIPMLIISASMLLSYEGEADLVIPMLMLDSEFAPDTYLSMVLNLKNSALSLYQNYLFNSLCRFNDVNLGATSTKIFNLNSGTMDNGVDIEWNFRLPYLDMSMKTNKRLRQAWFSYKSDGDIIITVVQPDGTQYEYDLKGYEITEDGVRVKFGKGIRSKYVAIDIKSKDGSTLDLDTIRLNVDNLSKVR